MQRRVAILAMFMAFVLPVHPALAAPEVRVEREGKLITRDSKPGSDSPGPRRSGGSRGPWYPYTTVELREGRYCNVTRYSRDPIRAAFIEDSDNILGNSFPDCPATAPGPRAVAQEFWDLRVLPTPVLRARPGWAIAGKKVYLEVLGERDRNFTVPNPLGPDVVIHATSEYTIDWGDRHNPDTNITKTTSPGGPWPHGDVTHVYTHADPGVTITVTQRWRATWEAGSEGGTLAELTTEGRLTDFRVAQLQAVRSR